MPEQHLLVCQSGDPRTGQEQKELWRIHNVKKWHSLTRIGNYTDTHQGRKSWIMAI